MDFLELTDKQILIFGAANRKSVAYHVGRVLAGAGAKCVYVVQNEEIRGSMAKLLGGAPVYVCDVEHEDQIARLREEVDALLVRLSHHEDEHERSGHLTHAPEQDVTDELAARWRPRDGGLIGHSVTSRERSCSRTWRTAAHVSAGFTLCSAALSRSTTFGGSGM